VYQTFSTNPNAENAKGIVQFIF